ncbi:hypothetical protein [Sulfuricaulis limicola]|nr:hypothetical protein [Sulfuricaulis limicola]
MATIKSFPGLIGFYVLTSDGELGVYDQHGKFVVDAKLTRAFADYNRRFLMSYLQNPEKGNFRLAIIHRTQEKRPWGSETLLLEKNIVRRLYPMTGTTELDLTVFQKKNREKSIYRGMEIFLEYKDTSTPDVPVYCPVLYDRGRTLDDYAANLDRPVTPADRETPVVEILNLLAGIPMGKRYTPEIGVLKEKIYQGIVKKGMRKSAEFTLIEDIRRNAVAATEKAVDDPYADVDKRAERQVTLNSKAGDADASHNANDNVLPRNIGSALMGRPEPAEPGTLKIFTRFRDMDHARLEALAGKCMVYRVPPGTPLLERGTNDSWNLYLIEGTVELVAADGMPKTIEGGTPTASNPISCLKPRMYTVSTLTRAAFLWIDDKLIDEVIKSTVESRRLGGAV